MKNKRSLILAVMLLLVSSTIVHAQFGSKLGIGKKSNGGPDTAQVLSQSGDFIKLVTLATDEGFLAMDELAKAFPPEKVAAFSELSKKYHETQKNRKDGNVDADGIQTASAAYAEFAKLDNDWKSYKKDGAKNVTKADQRLAYMLLVDGLAGIQLPPLSQSIQSTIQSVGSDPTQIGKLNQLKAYAQLFVVVGKETPKQIGSARTVRGIAKQIATAEKMTLAPDPSPDSVKDLASAQSQATNLGGE